MSQHNPYAAPQDEEPMQPALPKGVGHYAPCPSCGNTTAKKIGWTIWGGALGPKLLTHVRCTNCSCAYNGKSGMYNASGITMYLIISLVIGLALGIAFMAFIMSR